jgi:hypothetical protein
MLVTGEWLIMEHWWNEPHGRKPKSSNENLFYCHVVHTNPTQTGPSSSSSIFGAGGNPAYRPSAFEAACTLTPVLVPRSSPEALHTRRRERPLLAKGRIMGEKWPVKFSQTIRLPRNCCVLSHAANLQHGTVGFNSPPKEGMLRIFSPWKIRRFRPGLNPRTWVPEASLLTTRTPKPLSDWPLFDPGLLLTVWFMALPQ